MFYPVMLNLENKVTMVVGGGEVALRKVLTLLEYEAKIKVLSPQFIKGFYDISSKVILIEEDYRGELLEGAFFVIAATSSKNINSKVAAYCKDNKILCNVADDRKLSEVILPSSFRRGDLVFSISTCGKSPALAAKIKRELQIKYTEDYDRYVELLGDIRILVQEKCKDIKERKRILSSILDLRYEELILWKRNFERMK